MSAWKWLCLAEAIAILLAWMLLGGSESRAASEATENMLAAQSEVPPAPTLAAEQQPDVQEPDVEDHSEIRLPGPRPWSSTPDTLTLLVAVQDEVGDPVLEGSGNYQQDGSDKKQSFSLHDDHRLMLTGLRAGRIQFELRSNGFLPFSQEFLLASGHPIQRQVLRLKRARRVLLYLRTSKDELLQDWMRRELKWTTTDQRIDAQLLREPLAKDRPAKGARPRGNEWGDYIAVYWGKGKLPRACTGAFDLRSDLPLQAAAWLGRLFLGSTPIGADATEIVIRVDEAALRQRLASLRLRVVDAASGAPLPNVSVNLGYSTGGGSVGSTGADGISQFQYAVPENHDLELYLNGYASCCRELQLDPGAHLDLGDVPMSRAGRVRARLLGPDGVPRGSQSYTIFPTGAWTRPEEPQRRGNRTDADGWIDFSAGTERYQAIFGGGAYGLKAAVWERGSAEPAGREIRLLPGSEIRLLAVAQEGNTRVLWLTDTEGLLLAGSRLSSAAPIPFVLSAGLYLLRVEDLDRNLLGTLDLRVPEGGGDFEVALP